jgi:hypothetical protein
MLMVFKFLVILSIFIILVFINYSSQNYNAQKSKPVNFFKINKFLNERISLILSLMSLFLLLNLTNNTVVIAIIICLLCVFSLSARVSYTKNDVLTVLSLPYLWYRTYVVSFDLEKLSKLLFTDIILNTFKKTLQILANIIKININDVMVALFLKKADAIEDEDVFEQQFQFQKNFFKYKKPERIRRVFVGTVKETREFEAKIAFNKDPSKPINLVRRLPLFFDYTVFQNSELN